MKKNRPDFLKVQELDHTVPTQPTTPPNSASVQFRQGISAGGPWICQLVIHFRTRLHMKGSPNNSTSPAKKSENAWILRYSSATDLKIGTRQVYTYVRSNLKPI